MVRAIFLPRGCKPTAKICRHSVAQNKLKSNTELSDSPKPVRRTNMQFPITDPTQRFGRTTGVSSAFPHSDQPR